MASQFLLVIDDIIDNYRLLGQDAFIWETILMGVWSLFTKSAFFPHFKFGGFVSFKKSTVLPHFRNRRLCLIFEISGFVPFPESAVLSHLKLAGLSCPLGEHILLFLHYLALFVLKFFETVPPVPVRLGKIELNLQQIENWFPNVAMRNESWVNERSSSVFS